MIEFGQGVNEGGQFVEGRIEEGVDGLGGAQRETQEGGSRFPR